MPHSTRYLGWLALVALAGVSSAQDGSANTNGGGPEVSQSKPAPLDALQWFLRQPGTTQDTLLRGIERRLVRDSDPMLQFLLGNRRPTNKLPLAEPSPYHRAKDWAAGVAPTRVVIEPGDPRHAAVRHRYPKVPFMPHLHREVWYDWGKGILVRRSSPLTPREIGENLWNGYPPGTDQAVARILLALDKNAPKKTRLVAAYLDHLYADLNARVYSGVTLYEAWFSGEEQDVPDVDAIPFARQILQTNAFKSPIPGGPRRTALYQRIREHAFEHRKYRTLLEAAAAAAVAAEPVLPKAYQPLVPRFHYLWLRENDSVTAVTKILAAAKNRDALLARIDKDMAADDGAGHAMRKQRFEELTELRHRLRLYLTHAVKLSREQTGGQ